MPLTECDNCHGRGQTTAARSDMHKGFISFRITCSKCGGRCQLWEEDPSSERLDGHAKYLGLVDRIGKQFWIDRIGDRQMVEYLYYDDEGPVWKFAGGWRLGVPIVGPKMPRLPMSNPGMDIVIEDEE